MILTRLRERAKTCVLYKDLNKMFIGIYLFVVARKKKKKKKLLTIQTSIAWWNGKENTSCLYRGILFSNNNEKTVETWYDIDKSQKCYKIVKETRHKRNVLDDSIYMKFLKRQISKRQKAMFAWS